MSLIPLFTTNAPTSQLFYPFLAIHFCSVSLKGAWPHSTVL
jgi:hypothetical protein